MLCMQWKTWMKLLYIAVWLHLPLCKQLDHAKLILKHRTGKLKITVILTILASEEKIAPLLIFKAKEGKNTERRLKQTECVNK